MNKLYTLLIVFLAFFVTTSTNLDIKDLSSLPFFLTSTSTTPAPDPQVLSETIDTTTTRVVRVIDGDTIEVEGGKKVRYIGIDTPETKDPRKELQCFGREASEKNRQLIEGKTVLFEKDVSETDRYGRLLRYVYLPRENQEASGEAVFINDYLVRQGYAYASSYPPDVKYQEELQEAQIEAQENSRGLWKKCNE